MSTLLKWWIQFVLIIFAGVMINHLGWWELLYQADLTKISFLILGIFGLAVLGIGYLSTRTIENLRFDSTSTYIWYSTEAMITLGMIGTVAGFLLMLDGAFVGLDVQDTEAVKGVISSLAVGMSTSLSTTLVGLVCSTIVKTQMLIFENSENG